MTPIRLLLAASLLSPAAALAAATGNVSFNGKQWAVADAIAFKDVFGTKLVFAPVAWDRVSWADNGKFDAFDVHRFPAEATPLLLELSVREDGSYRGHRMSSGFGSNEGAVSDAPDALTLTGTSADAVAGSFRFESADYSIDLQFDLPVLKEDMPLERPGNALPADGGEPGKALLATLAASASGDIAQILTLAAPDRRARMEAMSKKPDFAKMMAMQKTMTPTAVVITSGKATDDHAWVDFTGSFDGKTKAGTAKLRRIDGRWYLQQVNTSEKN